MQTIQITASGGFLAEITELIKKLAREQNQELKIREFLDDEIPSFTDDEIYEEVLRRSEEIDNGTAELISFDEFKKEMREHLKTL